MAGLNLPHQKDSRWLQLEVCREAQRNKCTRGDDECKFAHPPAHVEITNGKVVACYDSIKGRCTRENPPCKYYHPPQHLKDQLLINGRNHLAMKNIMVQQQMQMHAVGLPSPQLPLQGHPQLSLINTSFYNPLVAALNQNPYLSPATSFLTSASPTASGSSIGGHTESSSPASLSNSSVMGQHHMSQSASANKNRMDRLEVCREFSRSACRRPENECRYAHPAEHVQVTDNMVVVCMDSLKGKCSRESCRYFHPPAHLVQQLKSRQSVNTSVFHGLATPVKRQTISPSLSISGSQQMAYLQQQQQLQAMLLNPLFSNFQQQLSMQSPLFQPPSPGPPSGYMHGVPQGLPPEVEPQYDGASSEKEEQPPSGSL